MNILQLLYLFSFVHFYALGTGDEPTTGDSGISCDETNPICQNFKIMQQQDALGENFKANKDMQEKFVRFENGGKSENILRNDEFSCDEKDPICQKFQALLEYQKNEAGPTAYKGNTSSPPQPIPALEMLCNGKCGNPICDQYCKGHLKRECYTAGKCGELVNEEGK